MEVHRPRLDERGLGGSLAQYAHPKGSQLIERTAPFHDWVEARRRAGTWLFTRYFEGPVTPTVDIEDDGGARFTGINYAVQDYLALSSHPAVRDAAQQAISDYGVHSPGSGVLVGNTALTRALERELAEFLETEHVLLFPTGWAAGFGAITALVRPQDYVVMDFFAHASLQQGAAAATTNVRRHLHLKLEDCRRILRGIRSKDTTNGILVISEGLYSMDSDSPDIGALQALCHEYDATLLIDVAHDLGALGADGTGCIGLQGLIGKVDLVSGTFSKTFASNGGFVASHSAAAKQYMKYFGGPHTFSNALTPPQAAVVLASLRLVRSDEGRSRRSALMRGIDALRKGFAAKGLECIGSASPIVPVRVGSERVARLGARLLHQRGVIVNEVEYPAVPVGAARFRFSAMATHTITQAGLAVAATADALQEAASLLQQPADAFAAPRDC